MKILIIEDEIPAANRLAAMVKEIEPGWSIITVLDEVKSSIDWLTNNPHPDLIFMDIQLADGFSFDIFDQVKIESSVIFVTAYDKYALNAFKVNGLDYILKPINKDELSNSIQRFKAFNHAKTLDYSTISAILALKEKNYKTRFLVKYGDQLNFVRIEEIAYFQSESSYSFVFTKSNNRYIIEETMDQIEEQVSPTLFFRVNRKQIVCIDCIDKISNHFNNRLKLELLPINNEETIVSRSKVKLFKNWLNQ